MQITRRSFMKILGATGIGAVASACSDLDKTPVEDLIPYVIPEEDVVPGIPTYYSGLCRECPAGCGLLAKTREGRVIKLEGNPHHPINRGSLCSRGQAGLQGLYNPDRIRSPHRKNESGDWVPISWEEGEAILVEKLKAVQAKGGRHRIAFLSENVSGTLDRLIDRWMKQFNSANRIVYECFSYETIREASRIVFDVDKVPTFHIEEADFLLSFGADFMETWLSPVEQSRGFAQMRRFEKGRMGKFVQAEPRRSMTGANADLWVPVKPGTEAYLAMGILHEVARNLWPRGVQNSEQAMVLAWLRSNQISAVKAQEVSGVDAGTIKQIAQEFSRAKSPLAIGPGVSGGGENGTITWIAAYLLNYFKGSLEKSVDFGRTQNVDRVASFKDMVRWVENLGRGDVDLLLIHQSNPMQTLPKGIGFKEALERVPFVVSFSGFWDETTSRADLILPDHHSLESFGDFHPQKGIYGLHQPAMRPVFQTKAIGDTLLSVASKFESNPFSETRYLDYLKGMWRTYHRRSNSARSFETFWEASLQRGGYWEDVRKRRVSLSGRLVKYRLKSPPSLKEGEYHLVVSPSPNLYDGRGANKPWLQEIPDPVTKIVWNSWVEIHPDVAKDLKLRHGSLVEIESSEGSLQVAVYLNEWMRRDTVCIPLGQGHEAYGRYAKGRGVNPLSLLSLTVDPVSGGWVLSSSPVKVRSTGGRALLVKTSARTDDLGRGIAEVVDYKEWRSSRWHEGGPHDVAGKILYDESWRDKKGIRWGMAIDTSLCIGCAACVAACYAENNVAVVGEEECARGREMSWIHIESYEKEHHGERMTVNVPMLCQHCGDAPCESVCPVYATYHNYEGLNVQVYNRCVGTRYCSNNCPYKVRRFNWFQNRFSEPLNLQLNPDVTVREKGVMEKCNFCRQRIRAGKDMAKDEGRLPHDGEIVTACMQTCPTNAIVFGDLNDPNSQVSKLARQERSYRAIEHIKTRPAIHYLKKVHRGLETA